jgi:hypothetical protein
MHTEFCRSPESKQMGRLRPKQDKIAIGVRRITGGNVNWIHVAQHVVQ